MTAAAPDSLARPCVGCSLPVPHLPRQPRYGVLRRLSANEFRNEYRGAIEGLDGRQVACKALDLNCRKLAGTTLSERRGPEVAGEHIRVAMHAEGHVLLRIHGVVPRARGKLNDP